MDSTEASSVDDSLDSKNLQPVVEDIVVAKYEDCNSEVLCGNSEVICGQNEFYGYLEVQNDSETENATIYIDSADNINLSGQRFILAQNEQGNEILVVVENPEALDNSILHDDGGHSDGGGHFENCVKENGTSLSEEQAQSLEYVEADASQEHEERHVYIESGGRIMNFIRGSHCSTDNMNIESAVWSDSNNGHSQQMVFIPQPTVVLPPQPLSPPPPQPLSPPPQPLSPPPQPLSPPPPPPLSVPPETKHQKLMALVQVAQQMRSSEERNCLADVDHKDDDHIDDDDGDNESPPPHSVIVTQSDTETNSKEAHMFTISERAKYLPTNDDEDENMDFDSKPSKSVDVSALLSSTSTQSIDNTVSVIHTTSSEVQESSLENPTKSSSPSDFSSARNFNSSENELPTEMLYPSNMERVSFHGSFDGSHVKQLEEECPRGDSEENSRLSVTDDNSNESKSLRNDATSNKELELGSDGNDSPICFIENSQKLDADSLDIGDNIPLEDDASTGMRVDDDDDDESHPGSCIIVVEEEESKGADEDSDMCVTVEDDPVLQSHVIKDSDMCVTAEVGPVLQSHVIKDSDMCTTAEDDPILQSHVIKDSDMCVTAEVGPVLQSHVIKDSDMCATAEDDPVLQGHAIKDSDMCSTAEDDAVLQGHAIKDSDMCVADEDDADFQGHAIKDSDMCITAEDDPVLQSPVLKDTDISQRTCSRENEVPSEAAREYDFDNEDVTSNNEPWVPVSRNKLPFAKKYDYKSKAIEPDSSPVLQNDKIGNETSVTDCQSKLSETNTKQLKDSGIEMDESSRTEPMDFENIDSDLVIAESADDKECSTDAMDLNFDKARSKSYEFKKASESKSSKNVDIPESEDASSTNTTSKATEDNILPSNSKTVVTEESDNEKFLVSTESVSLESDILKDNEDFSNNEETLVKPPKKTYIRKKISKNIVESKSIMKEKIELFSDFNFSACDKEIKDVESALSSEQQKESVSHSAEADNTEADDQLLLSDVQSKVSATYNRKKKSVPHKQVPLNTMQSRSLRHRSLPSRLPLENGTPEVSDSDLKKNSFDSSSSENIPWGDVLLKTSFRPCDVVDDSPSTSFAFQSTSSEQETISTPRISPEQQLRKLNKYKRDFDRLLSSPSSGTKRFKLSDRKRIPKRRRKSVNMSEPDAFTTSGSTSEFLGKNKSRPAHNMGSPRRRSKANETKEATIQYLNQQQSTSSPHRESKTSKEMLTCSSCNFSTIFVDNLMNHLKFCCSTEPRLSYRVNDMEKRQRIRGEDVKDAETPEELAKAVNNSWRNIRKTLKGGDSPVRFNSDADEDLDFLDKKSQYGYSEDDVVWVKFKDRFWPALVCDIKGLNAFVRLIDYPGEVKGLKVKHENIRTFDDFKWNLLCLSEAENLPNNKEFVIAVQSSETFMRRKCLGTQEVSGKQFFSVDNEVDFVTDSASSDSIINEDSDSEDIDGPIHWKMVEDQPMCASRRARYEKLDVEKILGFIVEGRADDYVLGIYNEERHSRRHKIFFKSKNPLTVNLQHRTWFGPYVKASQQERIYNHFLNLFNSKIGECADATPYVIQVWIPEALVKAISVIENISEEDAQCLLESEDSLDTEHDEPSIVDSLDASHGDHILVDSDS